MTHKFFSFFIVSILTILFSTYALARQPATHPDQMRDKWWWRVRYNFTPPIEPATLPCGEEIQYGFNVWGGIATQSNMELPISPTVGVDLEFCIKRYSDVNWAPSRVAFELLIGENKFEHIWLTNTGLGIRYQLPAWETMDGGIYWKYNYFTNFAQKLEDHHTLIFGLVGEYRPMSHFYLTARIGLGVDYYNKTQRSEFILEFLPSVGYRFANF